MSENKNKNLKRILFSMLLVMMAGIFSVKFLAQQDCFENPGTFPESFKSTDFRDEVHSSVAHWGEGYISLHKIGANFSVSNPAYIPNWINSVTSNDFDGDSWPDFIGSSSSYSNVLGFVKNQGVEGKIGTFEVTYWIDGCQGSGDVPTKGVKGEPIDTSGHCGMTSGDYDGDGDYDFLFMASEQNNPFKFKRIWLYENHLKGSGIPSFTQTDLTSQWSNELMGIAWSSTMMVSLDFDNDGDIDILTGNKDGKVKLIRNTHNQKINGDTFVVENSHLINTPWGGHRGVSTLSVADFDSDGDLDIIIGSVNYQELRYYKNDGTGNFTLYTTYEDLDGNLRDNEYDGAASVSICSDFDMDGDPDLMIGTDNWNYKKNDGTSTGYGGTCFYFKNKGGDFKSTLIFDNRPTVYDFDLGAYLDFDQDGDQDFLIADGNHSEKYYLFENGSADIYNLQGTAVSTNLTPHIDYRQQAVTKVRIRDVDMRVLGLSSEGLSIQFYFSNNGGRDWEFYTRFDGRELHDYTDLPWYTFKHFGSQLKWKAILTAADDSIEDYEEASWETPLIDQIELDYVYVDKREYSRTSVATATFLDETNQKTKLIISGTFYFPGSEGHLRAYKVSNVIPENSVYSILKTLSRSDLSAPSGREIVTSGVEIFWDAGELLNSREANNRTIYTATPQDSGLARIEFVAANVNTLGPILQDVNNDNVGLINFMRGEGLNWKLGEIDHSNPIVVGPPAGNPSQMGEGYLDFKNTWKSRKQVLYVGTNNGMLHCFEVRTGEELWGFIPYNLLPKLKNMWAVDQLTGGRYFARDVYVDGSPVVADVLLKGNWRTILVCGQGPGKGSSLGGGVNYYFALDISDPDNPQPLWEFTDKSMGETWSMPAISRVTVAGNPTWTCFMGSGYDNNPDVEAGNILYAVNVENGKGFWNFKAQDVHTSDKFLNIPNAIPGSPLIVDVDQNGYGDCLYFGDLDGRMWKVNVSVPFESRPNNKTSWDDEAKVIYKDSNGYPILCKPASWVNSVSGAKIPRLYFGTGGDDRAPSLETYSFIALIDGNAPEVEWYIGDPQILGLPAEKDKGDLSLGEKVWADPVIGDYIVYFSTLTGSIESVDPCLNLAGLGRLYARLIQVVAGAPVGGTAFTTTTGSIESLGLASKSRSAVRLGQREKTPDGTRKREVYIQEYDSTIQKLEQQVVAFLEVVGWREIYEIIK